MTRSAVIGGPADGLEVPVVTAPFRWIDPDRRQGFARPGAGRALYKRVADRWEFAGLLAWLCEGCGVVMLERVARPKQVCGLCGALRIRTVEVGDGG